MAGAKSYIIPHPDNGHWPHLLAHHHLAKVSVLLIMLKVAAMGIVALTPQQAYLSTITTNRIIQLTNEERKKVGASELIVNSKLSQAAQQKGQDMLKNQYFAHISPSGVTPWFWMKKAGYSYSVAGENLAIDFVDAETVVKAWLHSPSHTSNMLNRDYTETGVAIVSGSFQGGTSIIVVHMFGLPLGSTAPTPLPKVAAEISAPKSISTITPVATFTATPEPTVLATPTPEPPTQLHERQPPNDNTPPSLLLSPGFDRNEVALISGSDSTPWFALTTDAMTAIPSFTTQASSALIGVPSTVVSISRTTTAGILIAVAILLSLTIVIRIHVQHPALITHASLVIILASILLIA